MRSLASRTISVLQRLIGHCEMSFTLGSATIRGLVTVSRYVTGDYGTPAIIYDDFARNAVL